MAPEAGMPRSEFEAWFERQLYEAPSSWARSGATHDAREQRRLEYEEQRVGRFGTVATGWGRARMRFAA